MAEVVEFPLDDGGSLVVQAAGEDSAGRLGLASPGEKLKEAGETLESALRKVTPALKSVTGELRELSPDGVKVEFGLKLSAEHGVVIAKASGELHFAVTLNWGSADDD